MHDFKLALCQLGIEHQGHPLIFKNVKTADLADLEVIYASTRIEELAQTGWNQQQKDQFIKHQFLAQHQHYQTHFPQASFLIITYQDQIIGRFYLAQLKQSLCLIDITFLNEYRKQNLGSQILKWLTAYAQQNQLVITLHVESHNPAHNWYLKAGFKDIENRGVYQYMEWQP